MPRIFIASVFVLGDDHEYVSEWHTYVDAWEAALAKTQEVAASDALGEEKRADWGIKIYVCDIHSERSDIRHEWRRERAVSDW